MNKGKFEIGDYCNHIGLFAVLTEQLIFDHYNTQWDPFFTSVQNPTESVSLRELCTDESVDAFEEMLRSTGTAVINDIRLELVENRKHKHLYTFRAERVPGKIVLNGLAVESVEAEVTSRPFMPKLLDVGIWYVIPAEKEWHWNEASFKLYEFPEGTAISSPVIFERYVPPYREKLKAKIDQIYVDGKDFEEISKVETCTGKERWFQNKVRMTGFGKPHARLEGVTIDVTDAQERMIELKELSELQNAALKGIRSGLFNHDLIKNTVNYSPTFKEMIGLSKGGEHLEETLFREHIAQEDQAEAYARHLAELAADGNHYYNYFRLKHSDGSLNAYEVYGWKMLADTGKPFRLVGNLIDVEPQKRAEKQRALYLRNLEAVLSSELVHTFVIDKKGKILFADEQSIDFVIQEFRINPVMGQTSIYEVSNPALVPVLKKIFGRAMAGEEVRRELSAPTHSGAMRYVDMLVKPIILDSGRVDSAVLLILDITEREMARQAAYEARLELEQSLKSRLNIITNLNHEIRTPLNGLLGGVELLDTLERDDEDRELLQVVRTSAERLNATLSDIINANESLESRETIALEPVDLTAILRAEVNQYEFVARSKGIGIHWGGMDVPIFVLGNEKYLQIIVRQLLSNAVKFTAVGSVNISIKNKDESDVLEVMIADTGRGIAKENLDLIFDGFYQESSGLARDFEGSGIGLTIVKRQVESMGGSIRVESTVGEGSNFTIVLKKPE